MGHMLWLRQAQAITCMDEPLHFVFGCHRRFCCRSVHMLCMMLSHVPCLFAQPCCHERLGLRSLLNSKCMMLPCRLKRVQEEQDAQHRAQPTNQPSITQEPAASAAGQGRGYRARPAGRPAEQQSAHTFNPAVSHTGCEITEDRLWWSQ